SWPSAYPGVTSARWGRRLLCRQDRLLTRSGSDRRSQGIRVLRERNDPRTGRNECAVADGCEEFGECLTIACAPRRDEDRYGAGALARPRVSAQRGGGKARGGAAAPLAGCPAERCAHDTTTRAYGSPHGSAAGVVDGPVDAPCRRLEYLVDPRGVVVVVHRVRELFGVGAGARRRRAVDGEPSGGCELCGPGSDCAARTLDEDRSRALHQRVDGESGGEAIQRDRRRGRAVEEVRHRHQE